MTEFDDLTYCNPPTQIRSQDKILIDKMVYEAGCIGNIGKPWKNFAVRKWQQFTTLVPLFPIIILNKKVFKRRENLLDAARNRVTFLFRIMIVKRGFWCGKMLPFAHDQVIPGFTNNTYTLSLMYHFINLYFVSDYGSELRNLLILKTMFYNV